MNRINSNHTRDKTDEMKIILDFADIDKLKASRLLSDKTELALAVAKKSLSQLPEIFPNGSLERLKFEILAEIFLFNMISARDSILQKINGRLNSSMIKNKVRLDDNFKKKLKIDSNQNFKKILELLENCTSEPDKVIITESPEFWKWDRTKSWLWEINRMRNEITHRNILPQHIAVSVGSDEELNTSVIITSITKPPIVQIDGEKMTVPIQNPKTEALRESDIKNYFSTCYDKFVNLNNKISILLHFSRALDLSS
jgi:hypothetical protein